MAFIQDGSATAGNLAVETASKAARNILYSAAGQPITRKHNQARDEANDEAFIIGGYNDGNYRHIRTDRTGGQAVALHNPLLFEAFEGGNFQSARWTNIATTMAATQTAAAGLLFNSGSITTVNTGYLLKSLASFIKAQRAPLHFKARARFAHVVNSVMEIGFGDATTFNGANTNGAYWQVTSGGNIQPVLTYNGVDITGVAVSVLNPANFYTWDVLIDDDEAIFMVQDTSSGLILAERSIKLPVTQAKLFGATHLFAIARLYNTAAAPATAPQMVLSTVDVMMLDALLNRPFGHVLADNGLSADANPLTAAAMANWANSAAAASATLSNTAAGYSFPHGRFQFAAVAGAETDYALFGFQVPSPYKLAVSGGQIDTFNSGAAVATTGHVLDWWMASDLSAVSLATAALSRVPLGIQSFAVGDPVGKAAQQLNFDFRGNPRITNPGRFVVIALRMPVGTATASQIIRGSVRLDAMLY
jgi:hypothetical protein